VKLPIAWAEHWGSGDDAQRVTSAFGSLGESHPSQSGLGEVGGAPWTPPTFFPTNIKKSDQAAFAPRARTRGYCQNSGFRGMVPRCVLGKGRPRVDSGVITLPGRKLLGCSRKVAEEPSGSVAFRVWSRSFIGLIPNGCRKRAPRRWVRNNLFDPYPPARPFTQSPSKPTKWSNRAAAQM
jgi:hypothetical protein